MQYTYIRVMLLSIISKWSFGKWSFRLDETVSHLRVICQRVGTASAEKHPLIASFPWTDDMPARYATNNWIPTMPSPSVAAKTERDAQNATAPFLRPHRDRQSTPKVLHPALIRATCEVPLQAGSVVCKGWGWWHFINPSILRGNRG